MKREIVFMVTEIDRDELKQKLDHPKKFILVEALPPESYERAHLPGAINLPPEQVRTHASELMPRKDFEVVVYCAGPRCQVSGNVARELSDMGYSNVRRYVGGKEDWRIAGLPVAGKEGKRAA
jgi:rhodanese-related sulfurtransferase